MFFLLFFTTILVVVFASLTHIYQSAFNYHLGDDVKTLVIGNSHPQCAINDSLFGHCRNLSRAGEPFFYAQFKLEKLLKDNPQINQIVLEISDKEFKHQMEDWIFRPAVVENAVKAYWAYWPLWFHFDMFSNVGVDYFKFLLLGQKKYFLSLIQMDVSFFESLSWGGYRDSNVKIDLKKKNTFHSEFETQSDSLFYPMRGNLMALEHIQALTHSNHCRLSFIRCPVHESLHDSYERDYQNLIIEKMKIPVIDFRNLKLADDCFADEEHLNSHGATLFTGQLKDTILKLNKRQ